MLANIHIAHNVLKQNGKVAQPSDSDLNLNAWDKVLKNYPAVY